MNDYEISLNNWVKEQENLIEIFKTNADYLEKEIELKQIALKLNLDSLSHEVRALESFKLKNNIQ